MYPVDDRDRVIELPGAPASSIGAPIPVVLGTELKQVLLYYVRNVPEDWDGTAVRVIDSNSEDEPVARVTFELTCSSRFGPPNDEAFAGHPLAERGLHPYGAFEVIDSSWIRQLERLNRVHVSRQASHCESYRHFIFAFHDSTFECVAKSVTATVVNGPLADAARSALDDLWT